LIHLLKKISYSLLVLIGIVALVFIMFQGFGDPARLVAGQSGDKKTIEHIRKDLHLDEPKWKQFVLYLNDVSPVSFYNAAAIEQKKIAGLIFGGKTKFVLKFPYLGQDKIDGKYQFCLLFLI